MRLLALCLALALAGCDFYSEALTDDAPAVMADLDGIWTRTITQETIAADGEVTPVGEPRTDTYEVARSVRCFRLTLESAGDGSRAAVAYPVGNPDGGRDCGLVQSDHDGLRIIRIGEAPGSTDIAGTIRERSRSRHVWDFYTPLAGGETRRETWTLTAN